MNHVAKLLALIITTALMLPYNLAIASDKTILGEWKYESAASMDGLPFSELTLDLELRSAGSVELVGVYCYISNYGRRIDCPGENEENVRGILGPGRKSAELGIRLGNDSATTKVIVSLDGDKLRYEPDKAGTGSLYSRPRNVLLSRQAEKATIEP